MDYREVLKTSDAKKNFVKGLIRLAKADGVISQEEQQYFVAAAANIGLSTEEIAEVNDCIVTRDTVQVQFDSDAEKLLLFREGIQLCAIDGHYDENERTEVRLMATELGIPENSILRIEEWVQEGMTWKRRGDDLLTIN